ncbi:MAG: DUF4062 domain-containing protein [Bryobacterales bacterium]|nr:DUF4062 domain-containing protein [Bryobacterales bacterium]
MPLTHQKNVLRVFLASPTDLVDERRETKKIVDRINSTMREFSWDIELLAWEDRTPEFGRPQARINEYVDACDLFLGILWRRWGSPSGNFTSGFEEEFERAVNRRRKSESPEILIYFKSVKDTSDPGEQLRRVLAFRETVKQRRELLYGQFSTTSEWSDTCYHALLRHLLKRAFSRSWAPQSTASIIATSRLGNETPTGLPGTGTQLPEQLIRVSEALRNATREATAAQFNARLLALEDFYLVRFHLLGASLLHESVSRATLSNHTANLVYRYRDALGTLTGAEVWLAIESLLCDGNSYVPGWYWVDSLSNEKAAQLLENIAISHRDYEVRKATMNLLASRPFLAGMTRTNELVTAALVQPERQAIALSYAARYGDTKTADIIASQINDMPEIIQEVAYDIIGQICWKHDPNQLLDRLLDDKIEFKCRLTTFIDQANDTLDHTKLRQLLRHKSSDVRLMVAGALARKTLLTTEESKALLNDSDLRVRAIGIRRLIALGEPLTAKIIREILADELKTEPKASSPLMLSKQDTPRPDDLVEELFSTLSYSQLNELVHWFGIDGPIAYKVLGLKHFDRFGVRVRQDLADRFKSFYETEKRLLSEIYRGVLDEHGVSDARVISSVEDALEKQFARWSKLDKFITSQFASAAWAALAKNGSASDLEFARQHLNSEDHAISEAALKLVSRFGDESDVKPLLALADREYGDITERAAKAALSLSQDRWVRAKQYLDRGSVPFLRVGIDALSTHTDFLSRWPELRPYLFVDNTNVRLGTAKLICTRLGYTDLVKLMNQCLEDETYYYDVITVLDRFLYGPVAWHSV